MIRSLYRVVSCLLLVLMPLQGLAMTSRLACGPNHHRMLPAADHSAAAPTSGGLHHHADGSAHAHATQGHSDPGLADSHQPGLASDQFQPIGSESQLGYTLKCNACAPCCGGAVLADDVLSVIAAPVRIADFPPLVDVRHSAHVGNLYRPPKPILA